MYLILLWSTAPNPHVSSFIDLNLQIHRSKWFKSWTQPGDNELANSFSEWNVKYIYCGDQDFFDI